MPGTPSKFVVVDLVVERLRASAAPIISTLDEPGVMPYVYLGSMGGAFGDFMSSRPEVTSTLGNTNSPYFNIWQPILGLFAGTTTPPNRGLYRGLRQLRTTLAKLQDVIAREAKFELIGMVDELKDLTNVITEIQALMAALNGTGGGTPLRQTIGLAIINSRPREKVPQGPGTAWQSRDAMAASKTGVFLRALRELADASTDSRLKAYALGASIGYGADVSGNPYINSITRSVYRNHWWRHRWISNFVDTWVYGFYRQGGGASVRLPGQVPNPPYTNWPNLTESNLQKRIELPGLDPEALLNAVRDQTALPNLLPAEFVDYWKSAYATAYGPQPADGPAGDAGLQSAYAMAWLILWIQTSGDLIPSIPMDQVNYPDSCGTRPPWVAADGSVVTGTAPGGVATPPPASEDTDPSIAEIISGIVAAIVGVANILVGNVAGGIALIVAGAALIADGATDPDWDELRCYTGWVQAYLANLTNAFHDLMKWSGLGFPYTSELAHDEIALLQAGLVIPPESALGTVRSVGPNVSFPATVVCPKPWRPSFVNGGHECLVVQCSCPGEGTNGLKFPFQAAVDRHVGQRNLTVTDSAAPKPLKLIAPNPFREKMSFTVRLLSTLVSINTDGLKGMTLSEIMALVGDLAAGGEVAEVQYQVTNVSGRDFGVRAKVTERNTLKRRELPRVSHQQFLDERVQASPDLYPDAFGSVLNEFSLGPFEAAHLAVHVPPVNLGSETFIVHRMAQVAGIAQLGGYTVIVAPVELLERFS